MKLVIVAAAAIISTLAGSYAAALLTGDSKDQAQVGSPAVEVIKLDAISVPVIRNGAIQGYVLARAAVAVPVEEAKKSRAVITLYSAEGIFRAIHEDEIDFSALRSADVARLADHATRLINGRVGREAVSRTVIESVNFVPQSDVRQQVGPRRNGAQQR